MDERPICAILGLDELYAWCCGEVTVAGEAVRMQDVVLPGMVAHTGRDAMDACAESAGMGDG